MLWQTICDTETKACPTEVSGISYRNTEKKHCMM